MPINLISKIVPKNNGQFPVVEDSHIQGGQQTVATITDRDNIPVLNRKEGMQVKVLADEFVYQLRGGIDNTNWVKAPIPSSNISNNSYLSGVELTADFGKSLNILMPAEAVSDGYDLYIGQHHFNFTPIDGLSLFWKVTVSGSTVTNAASIDLFNYFKPTGIYTNNKIQVSCVAQDDGYVYAGCYDTGQVAIIDKLTFNVVGWFNTGLSTVTVNHIATDNLGHVYIAITGGTKRLYKYTTATHIGQPILNNVAYDGYILDTESVFDVSYGGGYLWTTNYGGSGHVLSKIDPTTMGIVSQILTIDGHSNTYRVVYAFGSVWLSVAGTNSVYRVDPSTLLILPGYPITVSDFATNFISGPNNIGTANSLLYMVGQVVQDINPLTDTLSVPLTVNAGGGHLSATVINNFIYFANIIQGTIDYYNAITQDFGFIAYPLQQIDWQHNYNKTLGDVVFGASGNKILTLNSLDINSSVVPSAENQVIAVKKATTDMQGITYDSISQKYFVNSGNTAKIYEYSLVGDSIKTHNLLDTNVYNIPMTFGIGTTKVVGNNIFSTCGVNSTVGAIVTDKTSYKTYSKCLSKCVDFKTGLAIDGDNLWLSGNIFLERYSIADLTDNKKLDHTSNFHILATPFTGFSAIEIMDGYVFVGSNDGYIRYCVSNDTNPILQNLWSHPTGVGINYVKMAQGDLITSHSNGDIYILHLTIAGTLSVSPVLVTGTDVGGFYNIIDGVDYIWATDWNNNKIQIIDYVTHSVVYTFISSDVNSFYSDAVLDTASNTMIVVNNGTGLLSKFNIATLPVSLTEIVVSAPFTSQWTTLPSGGGGGGPAPAIDANHLYVYDCTELSGDLNNTGANSAGLNGILYFDTTNDVVYNSGRIGRSAKSIRLIGNSSSASAGAYTSKGSESVTGGAVTLEAFVVPHVMQQNGGTLISAYTDLSNNHIKIAVTQTTNPYWFVEVRVGATTQTTVGDVSNPWVLEYGAPQHVMATYSNLTGIKLYINGTLAGSYNAGIGTMTTLNNFALGNDYNTGSNPFNGWVMQARISNIVRTVKYAVDTTETLFKM